MNQSGFRHSSAGPAPASLRNAILAECVAFGAIGLFVITGSRALGDAIAWLFYAGGGSERIAIIALFLNLALLVFAWRRYTDIRALIAENALAEERVKALATHDQLTKLLIRNSLLEAGDDLIARSKSNDLGVALLCLDVGQLKKINDLHGHIAGDALLRSAANLLTGHCPRNALCARTGGSRFALLVPFSGQADIDALAEELSTSLARPLEAGGALVHLNASIGIASTAADRGTTDALLRSADIALSVARRDCSRSIVWFDDTMESELRARNEVETGLRRGIPLGEFLPFYQPQVDLSTGRICGFEALARWAHPAGGHVDPDIFIPVAEETGLIGDLFESLFRQALEDALQWDSGLTLAVNISAAQLKDPLLAHKILKQLSQSGFPARRLEIEVTETSLFENIATAQAVVRSLKNHGITLALDDFGTGYSSLAHLRALPFDRIKIDRSFVKGMSRDTECMTIVRAVAMMADSLGVAVTAEGIEESVTAGLLREIGCDKGQGWLYGRALSARDVYALLTECDLLAYQAAWTPAIVPARRGPRQFQRRSAA